MGAWLKTICLVSGYRRVWYSEAGNLWSCWITLDTLWLVQANWYDPLRGVCITLYALSRVFGPLLPWYTPFCTSRLWCRTLIWLYLSDYVWTQAFFDSIFLHNKRIFLLYWWIDNLCNVTYVTENDFWTCNTNFMCLHRFLNCIIKKWIGLQLWFHVLHVMLQDCLPWYFLYLIYLYHRTFAFMHVCST